MGFVCLPTPPGWIPEQSEVQVAHLTERPQATSGGLGGGRRSSSESPQSNKEMPGEDEQTRHPKAKKRELLAWMDFLLGD